MFHRVSSATRPMDAAKLSDGRSVLKAILRSMLTTTIFVSVGMASLLSLGVTPAAQAASPTPTWGAPLSVVPVPDESPVIEGTSCATTSFCVAVDGSGNAYTFNGTSWSGATDIDTQINGNGSSMTGLSCPTTTFCMAIDSSGYAVSYNGTSWSTPQLIDGTGVLSGTVSLESISCPTSSFCAVGDQNSSALVYQSGVWGKPQVIDNTTQLSGTASIQGISCASASFCVAVDTKANAIIYNGSSWGAAQTADDGVGTIANNPQTIESVSCVSTTFCMATDASGEAVEFNGSTWQTPVQIVSDFSNTKNISCASTSFCVTGIDAPNASTYTGNVVEFNNGTWSAPQLIDSSGGANGTDILSMSCPTTTFCMAGDMIGDIIQYGQTGASQPTAGYWMLDSAGNVYQFGSAQNYGNGTNLGSASAIAATPDGAGYWVFSGSGNFDAYGDAGKYSYTGQASSPIIAVTSTQDGKGYWVATSGGQVLPAGDAKDFGSPAESGIHLNGGIVAMTATSDGGGYWLLGADGGVFSYGDASFFGSSEQINPGNAPGGSNSFVPNKPLNGIVETSGGKGYWMVASDGGIFAFGNAGFLGSSGQILPSKPAGGNNAFIPVKPIVSMVATSDGKGYWMVASDGGVFAFGDAGFVGSLGANPPSHAIVGFAPN